MFEFDNKLRMAYNHNCYYHFVERNKAIVSVFGKNLGYVLRSKSILKKSLSKYCNIIFEIKCHCHKVKVTLE